MAYLTTRQGITMKMARGSLKHCILFLFLLPLYHAYENPKKYTLYRLVALTKRDRQILYIIHKNLAESNFLNGITNEAAIPMHIAVEDHKMDDFQRLLNSTDALYTKYLLYTYYPKPIDEQFYAEVTDDSFVAYEFNEFAAILQLYKYWETKYPHTFKKIVIGSTLHQKDIIILKVSGETPRSRYKNPAVFMIGGEEGRDWISPAVVLTYVKKLLEGRLGDWPKRLDMYFLPVLNPDGYDYSIHEDRFWGKNRNRLRPRIMCRNREEAIGVHIDRNWLYRNRGDEPCSKMYFGGYLSEPETYNLSEFLDSLAPRTLAFFNVKGFDNLITTPFADKDKFQNNYATIKEILQHTTGELNAIFNKSYYYGTTRSLLFNYTGSCADWVKENLNVPVVATFYMKHEDHIIPHENDIEPLFEELSTGLNMILSLTIDLYEPLFNSQWRHDNYHIVLLFINMCLIMM